MSLDYNLLSVRPDLPIESEERKLWWEELDWDSFQSLVFNTIPVGINHITEENYIEFYRRLVMLYTAKGWGKPYYPLSFVKEFIGMRTNASKITDAAFKKVLLDSLLRTANSVISEENSHEAENL